MGGIVKEPKKKYKMGLGKKIVAAICAVLIVVGVGLGVYFGLANKDNNNIIDQPGIEQPENPENPGGDIEQPEDPENPGGDIGEPEDPENPGGEIEEPEDPENPGGDIEEPEDPENPGGDIEDPKDPFVLDTINELKEYKGETFYNYLNDNYLSSVVTKLAGRSAVVENADNIEWAITGTEGEAITEMQVRFVYHTGKSYMYYVGTVNPNENITINDILNGESISASIIYDYSANTIEADMEQNQPLAEAIVTELGGTIGANDQLLITLNNTTTDPEFSSIRSCVVKQITETGVNEYQISIASPGGDGSISTLLKSLEEGKYKNQKVEKNVIELAPAFDENSVDKQTPEYENTAKTASRVSIGRMTNENGDVYDLYLDL